MTIQFPPVKRKKTLELLWKELGKRFAGPYMGMAEQCALARLEERGCELVEVSLPHASYAIPTYYVVATAEASSNLARYDGIRYTSRSERAENAVDVYAKSRGEGFGEEVKRRCILGAYGLSSGYYDAYYLKAQKTRTLIRQDFDRAFEEGIRWVAPIQVSSRLVMEDTEIRGFHIPKGDTVMTIQASANRDEDRYEDGESFQVYRERQSHQAFGNGPHFCQGTHVARRAVAHVMLPMLFDRFPDMTIPDLDDVIWRGFGFRGPTQIPVKLQ